MTNELRVRERVAIFPSSESESREFTWDVGADLCICPFRNTGEYRKKGSRKGRPYKIHPDFFNVILNAGSSVHTDEHTGLPI